MPHKTLNAEINLNPHLSVDCVVFGFAEDKLHLLVIRRTIHSEKGDKPDKFYALPGDLVRDNENLDQAASRILHELTGLNDIYLKQFKAFGDPNRIRKPKDKKWLQNIRQNPDARVITVAYFALINSDNITLHPGGFSIDALWIPVTEVPELGFDHNEIFTEAIAILQNKLDYEPIGFELLPEKFTLPQLQVLYESILNITLDKRNFRRKMLNSKIITPLKENNLV